jgi:hypothetical protein
MNYKRQILTGLFICFFISFISSFTRFTGKDKGNICPVSLLVNSPQRDRVQADIGRPGILVSSIQDAPPGKTTCREKRHKKSRKVEMVMPVVSEVLLKNFFCSSSHHLPLYTRIFSNERLGFSLRGPPGGFENM